MFRRMIYQTVYHAWATRNRQEITVIKVLSGRRQRECGAFRTSSNGLICPVVRLKPFYRSWKVSAYTGGYLSLKMKMFLGVEIGLDAGPT